MRVVLINFDISGINIVIADRGDIERICKLNQNEYWEDIKSVDKETQFRLGKWWIDTELLKWHKDRIEACGGNILIIKRDNEIIAELDFVRSKEYDGNYFSRLHIIWLLVKKEYRRFGIAKRMIQNLKSRFPEYEIWVEPEDHRSLKLYQSIGVQRQSIDTWKLNSRDNFSKNNQYNFVENLKLLDYRQLINMIEENKVSCIMGRYYAPSFDIEQLNNSEDVHQYIWGETAKTSIFVCKSNNLKLYAILTQYLRIYIDNPNYDKEDFDLLVEYILTKTFSLGFEEIFIQVYHNLKLTGTLKKLGCKLDEENYPIFKL